jgi:hypothetical protein
MKEYTAPTRVIKQPVQLLSFLQFFRQQHISYPYWTDFAYRSSHFCEAREFFPGSVFIYS